VNLYAIAEYISDRSFADDIMLISDDTVNAQQQLDSVDVMARRVGLKINGLRPSLLW
jgi:hypothetical protein